MENFRQFRVPLTLYDLFGYLIPGILFFALFPISYDFSLIMNGLKELVQIGKFTTPKDFLILKMKDFYITTVWYSIFYTILISYLMGHIIAGIGSFFYERIIIDKFLKYPTANLFKLRSYNGILEDKIFKVVHWLPSWAKGWVFGNYRRPYSQEFQVKFSEKFQITFGFLPNHQSDIFWTVFAYIAHHCPASFHRATHFLNLYGFSRNLSFMFLMFSTSLILFDFYHHLSIDYRLIFLYIFLAGVFFWQYLKFFRRLNDEIYRAFAAIEPQMNFPEKANYAQV